MCRGEKSAKSDRTRSWLGRAEGRKSVGEGQKEARERGQKEEGYQQNQREERQKVGEGGEMENEVGEV